MSLFLSISVFPTSVHSTFMMQQLLVATNPLTLHEWIQFYIYLIRTITLQPRISESKKHIQSKALNNMTKTRFSAE